MTNHGHEPIITKDCSCGNNLAQNNFMTGAVEGTEFKS